MGDNEMYLYRICELGTVEDEQVNVIEPQYKMVVADNMEDYLKVVGWTELWFREGHTRVSPKQLKDACDKCELNGQPYHMVYRNCQKWVFNVLRKLGIDPDLVDLQAAGKYWK